MHVVGLVSLLLVPISARNIICHFLFQVFCVRRNLCLWILGLQSQIVTLSLLAKTCCTGRAWMDRWPDPQLSIWPIKLSKKASSLQIPVLISLPTVWPMGVSVQCQRGGEKKEGSWRICGVRGREVPAGQVPGCWGCDHFSPWGAGEGQQSWLPWALLQGGRAQNESLKQWPRPLDTLCLRDLPLDLLMASALSIQKRGIIPMPFSSTWASSSQDRWTEDKTTEGMPNCLLGFINGSFSSEGRWRRQQFVRKGVVNANDPIS